ncbi:MAG: WhiB family transcriptional regulator [Ilumatobacter sp.]|uniref:WhiB family transcriptional regulator n=1 Tax=Ilumatobacter sp. TaxID=1967498 RepID=UPI003C72DB36
MNLTLASAPTITDTDTDTCTTARAVVPDTGDFDETEVRSSYARCADGNGTLSHLFFSEDDHDLARAKAICRPCGLRETCLSGALERMEPYGVWGGKLVLDGLPVEVKRKRGRPRKHPKPILVVDEAPIPEHLVA